VDSGIATNRAFQASAGASGPIVSHLGALPLQQELRLIRSGGVPPVRRYFSVSYRFLRGRAVARHLGIDLISNTSLRDAHFEKEIKSTDHRASGPVSSGHDLLQFSAITHHKPGRGRGRKGQNQINRPAPPGVQASFQGTARTYKAIGSNDVVASGKRGADIVLGVLMRAFSPSITLCRRFIGGVGALLAFMLFKQDHWHCGHHRILLLIAL